MADNTTVNTGTAISGATNKTFASDDIGGVQYPRTKITLGADGFNDGDVSSSNPMPISGPVTVSGVATAANQTTGNTSLSSIDAKLTDVATQTTLAAINTKLPSSPATDRTTAAAPFAVRLSDGSAFVDVATAANQSTANTSLAQIDTDLGALTETAPASDTASSGLNGRLQRIAQRLTSLITLLPSALVSGRLDVNLGAAPATVTTNMVRGTTATVTPVSSSATSVQIIAANASRLGLSVYNDSNQSLYLRYGSGAASTTDYSVLVQAGGLYEVPDRSVQLELRGIWPSANGSARVTEVS